MHTVKPVFYERISNSPRFETNVPDVPDVFKMYICMYALYVTVFILQVWFFIFIVRLRQIF